MYKILTFYLKPDGLVTRSRIFGKTLHNTIAFTIAKRPAETDPSEVKVAHFWSEITHTFWLHRYHYTRSC
jgi:hypothetical protein